MRASRPWIITIAVVTVLSPILMVPTFLGDSLPGWWGKLFPDRGIRLGLDLRGGIFLMLGVDTDKSIEQELNSDLDFLKQELKNDIVIIKGYERNEKTLTRMFYSSEDVSATASLAE